VGPAIQTGQDRYFHVVPVTKGDIQETKLQTKSKEHFRAVPKNLEESRKSYLLHRGTARCNAQIARSMDTPGHTVHFHNSANKEEPKKKKSVNCQGNHTANFSGCPIYKEMKDQMRKKTATRHQNTQNAYSYSRTTPELNTQKVFSYSDAFRSGTENPLQSNLGNAQQNSCHS